MEASALVAVVVTSSLVQSEEVNKILGGLGKEMLLNIEAVAATGVVVVGCDDRILTVAETEAAMAWLVPFELNKSVFLRMVAVTMSATGAWL